MFGKDFGSQLQNVENLGDKRRVSPPLSMWDRLTREGVGQVWSYVNNLLESTYALSPTRSLSQLTCEPSTEYRTECFDFGNDKKGNGTSCQIFL